MFLIGSCFYLRILTFFLVWRLSYFERRDDRHDSSCDDLLPGQYKCQSPTIDPATQSAAECTKDHTVKVNCSTAPNLTCLADDGKTSVSTFKRSVPCRFTNGHSYDTALLLSVFLGMFGIDRFYLGYPAIGLLKFCTLGFFFLFQLVDIILIASQIVGPADGSDYIVDYYGPGLIHITQDNSTVYKPQNFS